MEAMRELKERQLRPVVEDYDRCHYADALCAERQQLIHEACRELDRPALEREEAACLMAPGCDNGEECMGMARGWARQRVETCALSKA